MSRQKGDVLPGLMTSNPMPLFPGTFLLPSESPGSLDSLISPVLLRAE